MVIILKATKSWECYVWSRIRLWPFRVACSSKRFLPVSIDHKNNWLESIFQRKPTTDKVLDFFHIHIAIYGIPKSYRTDLGTAFKSDTFRKCCLWCFVNQNIGTVHNHRRNGKDGWPIRTISKRLRTKRRTVLERTNQGLFDILISLRTNDSTTDAKSPFQMNMGWKSNASVLLIFTKLNRF